MRRNGIWLTIYLFTLFLASRMPSAAMCYEVQNKDLPLVFPTYPEKSVGCLSEVRVMVSGTVKITTDAETLSGGSFTVRIIEEDPVSDDYLEDCVVRFPKGGKNSIVRYFGIAPCLKLSGVGALVGSKGFSVGDVPYQVGFELTSGGENSQTVGVQPVIGGGVNSTCCKFSSLVPTTATDSGKPGDPSKECVHHDSLNPGETPSNVSSSTTYGLITLVVLLAGSAIWFFRKR